MVEVLVSLLLMTLGLLGIGGLLLSGVNNTTGFDLASRASQSASEIMDAMRANSNNASAYITEYGTKPSTLTATSPASADRKQWLEAINRLPGGDGQIKYADETSACAVALASICEYEVTVRFSNCIGSLSKAEFDNCVAASNNNEKRPVTFRFRI